MAVTIAEQPVLTDSEQQAASFIGSCIPSCDLLFGRHEQRAPLNPYTQCDGLEWLETPYPSLPNVEIGQLQWPSGASRYARAMYLVDGESMRKIAQASFLTDPMRNTSVDFTQIPEDWGAHWNPVEVTISDDRLQPGILHNTFTAKMYPLPPHRVPGHEAELFILPLVCKRFLLNKLFAQANAFDSQNSELEWAELFAKYSADLGVPVAVNGLNQDWLTPHADMYRSRQPATTMLDVASLSCGLRAAWMPDESGFVVQGYTAADTARNVRFSYPDRTAGGKRGAGALPERIELKWRNGETGANNTASFTVPGVASSYVQDVHTAWFANGGDDSEGLGTGGASTLVESIAKTVRDWSNCAGYYSHAGAMGYNPCGYDDYFLIEWLEKSGGDYRFSTRIQELPAPLLPKVFMQGQDRDCDCSGPEHLAFQLQSAWSGGIALAYLMTMEQEFVTDSAGNPVLVVLRDPQSIYDFMKVGQRGFLVRQNCRYYAWIADCDGPTYPPPIGGGE